MVIPHHDTIVQAAPYPRNNLLVGRVGGRVAARRSVRGTTGSRVVVRATIVIGVVVRTIAVGVVVATAPAGVGTSRSVVVVSLTVGS